MVQQRGGQRGGDEPGCERVGDGAERTDRLAVGPTGQVVEARERRALAAEAGIVAVRPGLAVEARADHHEIGLVDDEVVVREPEAAHRPRREVLADGVGPLDDEPLGERVSVGMLEVERDGALAAVERVEHVGVVAGAEEVGPARRLDPHDRRAVLGEVPRGDRPRRPRPELEDPRPRPTPRACRSCASTTCDIAPVASNGRNGRGRGPTSTGCRRGVEELAGRELGGRVQLAGRVHRGEHEVGLARVLVELRGACGGRTIRRRPAAPRRRPRRTRRATSHVVQSRSVSTGSSTSRAIVSSDGMRALPPRKPNETQPSFVGQISRVRPMLAPARLAWTCDRNQRPAPPMLATSTVSCIDRSTSSGRTPDASAVNAANAISGAVCAYAASPAQRTGGRSGSPVQ